MCGLPKPSIDGFDTFLEKGLVVIIPQQINNIIILLKNSHFLVEESEEARAIHSQSARLVPAAAQG